MKTFKNVLILIAAVTLCQPLFSQIDDKKDFKLTGRRPASLQVNQTFSSNSDISPIGNQVTAIYGLAVSADVTFNGENGLVRVTLFDENYSEYLVYETYSLLEGSESVSIDALCEETALLEGIDPLFLRIEVKDASVTVRQVSFTTDLSGVLDIPKARKEKKSAQDNYKINKLNKNLSAKGLLWGAGVTEVSELSFANRKKLYGEGTIPPGFEYYAGGVFTEGDRFKSATATTMVEQWDWRNRHGVNWLTSVKYQGACGSCWAFAATGATEAQVNLFFNQGGLNLDLSEQDLVSCSGGGSCTGGYPSTALNYISTTGIVDEVAFPYSATNDLCANKSTNPAQLIKIAGKVDFGSAAYPASEDNLKKMIIKYGPVSGGLYSWSHAMTLVGWQVVKEGDRFFYHDLAGNNYWITVPAGSALIGKTVWIFKNSWNSYWGDAGYVYVETAITNVGWTHALVSPVTSLKQTYTVACVDADGDGYYWWGLGARPATCPNLLSEDGDDSNSTLGPLNEYGYCTINGGAALPPVANFSADDTSIAPTGSVNFTDLSTNEPTSWSWSFAGGNPSSSSAKNPVVAYGAAGSYNVTLTVNNSSNVSNTKEQFNYIVVVSNVVKYCASNGNASKEWIKSVSFNGLTYTSGSSGVLGYQNITTSGFTVPANSFPSITLVPAFSSKATTEYYAVWIDFNQDSDFSDAGELVTTASRVKGNVTRTITIPENAVTGTTRMRVSMKRTGVPTTCEIFSAGEVEDYLITIDNAKSGGFTEFTESTPSLKIFPNPANRLLNLQLGEVGDQAKLAIYNMNGQMMLMQTIRDIVTQVDVESLPAGLYIVLVNNGNTIYREKFLKD